MRAFNSTEGITYSRVVSGINVTGVSGTFLTYEQFSTMARDVEMPIGVRVPVAVLILSSDALGFEPVIGDQVYIPVGGSSVLHDVCEGPGDGKAWAYFDKHRYQIQIYLQESE